MLASFNGLLNAPVYDVSAQASNIQQAYGLYRAAIDMLNTQATLVRACGADGIGTLGPVEMGEARRIIGDAVNQLGQAWQLVRSEASGSTVPAAYAPLLTALQQAIHDADQLGNIFKTSDLGHYRRPLEKAKNFPCAEFIATFNRVNAAPVFGTAALSPELQAAYRKYRAGITEIVNGSTPLFQRCADPDNEITADLISPLEASATIAHEYFAEALRQLGY